MEYFYFNKNKFIGQDKLLEYNNYCISKWKLEEKDNNLYDYIIDKYRNEFDNPKSKFRLKVIDNRIFSYSNDTIDNIISYSFEKIISIDDLNNYQVIEKTLKKFNRNKLLFLIGNDGFIFCCSHLFIDWLSNRNLCCIISDCNESFELPNINYLPIKNELITLYLSTKMLKFISKKRNLKFDYDWNFDIKKDKLKLVKNNINTNVIKKIKHEIENETNKKISFVIVVSALQIYSIFESSNVKKLNFGIVYGFINNNRFNNFTVIIIEVKKDYDSIEIKNNFKSVLKKLIIDINKKIEINKYQLSLFYNISEYLVRH